jgi:uncharacterized OsmC-like protein
MDEKQQWIDDVLQSLNGIQQAEPNADLFDKIMAQLPKEKAVKIIPLQRLAWIAAAACIVISANIYVFKAEIKINQNKLAVTSELLSDYSLYN